MRIISLQANSHARYKIRDHTKVISKNWGLCFTSHSECVPRIQDGAVILSSTAAKIIKNKLAEKNVTTENSGLLKREWNTLVEVLIL